jgi:hypothetical protein
MVRATGSFFSLDMLTLSLTTHLTFLQNFTGCLLLTSYLKKKHDYAKCLLGQVHTQNFSFRGEGADPEALHNLRKFLKITLQKSCCKHNITLSATSFIYMRI